MYVHAPCVFVLYIDFADSLISKVKVLIQYTLDHCLNDFIKQTGGNAILCSFYDKNVIHDNICCKYFKNAR